MNEPTDAQLLATAATGSSDAFAALLQRHHVTMRGAALRFCDAPADAEDALQDAILAAWLGAASFRGESSVRTWLVTVTLNACRRTRRRRVGQPAATVPLDETLAGDEAPDRTVANRELRARIKRGLRELDASAREVVVLRDVVGMSGEETAAALDLSLAAMKSRLHRGRLALKQRLEDPSPAPPPSLSIACADVLEELSPYLDGELGPDGRTAVELHLRGCDRCTRFGGEFAAMLAGLRESLLGG